MKKTKLILLLFTFVVISCSTGQKALQKGNYYNAITKAVERLKSDPSNTKALDVLRDGYPLTLKWSQEELDLALSSNQAFKWEKTIDIMQQVNRLSDLIRSTPAAREIIGETTTYSSELNMAYEKAAEDRYQSGLQFLAENTRESARNAYNSFAKADQMIPAYNDVTQKMAIAKEMATLKVIVEAITVRTKTYQLSSEFFYDQIFEYLNNQFPNQGFVNFLSPSEAEKFQVTQPDFVVQMEFYDFSVGNLVRHVKEEEIVKRDKVAINDTTSVTKTYRAKLKTYTDEIISNGRLSYKIVDFKQDKLMRDELVPGSFTWINNYALFVGDEKALSDIQYNLTKTNVVPPPPNQELFIEFTRPIYDQVTTDLHNFFRRYR
jgi:hypothetical protein